MSQAGQAQDILQGLMPEGYSYTSLSDLAVAVCGLVEDLERQVRKAEVRGAVKAIGRVAEEIDEDKRYPGFDLVIWLTGLQNGIGSGAVSLDPEPVKLP